MSYLVPMCVKQMMFSLEQQAEAKAVTVMLVGMWAFGMSLLLSALHWLFGDNQELCLDTVLWLARHGVIQPQKAPPTRNLLPLRQQARGRIGSQALTPSSPRPTSTVATPDAVAIKGTPKSVDGSLKLGGGGGMAMAHAAATVLDTPTPKEIKVDWDRDTKNLDKPLRKEGPVRYGIHHICIRTSHSWLDRS